MHMAIIKIGSITGLLFLSLFGFNSFSMEDNYDELWEKVIEFENQKKPKSALAEVEKIYAKATREKKTIHLTKAIIYKSKFLMQTQEESYEAVVKLFKEEIAKSPSPTKEILLSVEATLYSQYLQHNRWEIQQRNRIEDFEENNPVTWPANTFIEKIAANFQASISNPDVLTEPLDKYNALLNMYDEETLIHYPTLYDLLTYRAVNFFSNSNSYLTAPVYQFLIDDKKYFAPVDDFMNMQLESKDSTSLLFQGLNIIQDHLKYNESRPEAKAYIDLKRIQLVYTQGNFIDKEKYYLESLVRIEKEYSNVKVHADIYLALANYYNNKAHREYKVRTDDFATALEYCNKAIEQYPEHPATYNCINILNGIKSQNLHVVSEQAYPSNKDFLVKINAKNIDQVYLELVALEFKDLAQLEKLRGKNKAFDFIKKKKAFKSWSQSIYNDHKYYALDSEIEVQGLPVGFYGLVISDKSDVYDGEARSRILIINITDLSFKLFSGGQNQKAYVMDRVTGEPIAGAEVICFNQRYDRDKRENFKEVIATYITDKDGKTDIQIGSNERYSIDIKRGADYFTTNDNFYNYNNRNNNSRNYAVIYTDRAIYRPGQTVYFKLLKLRKDAKGIPSLEKNQNVRVTFYDANRQEVETKELVTNDYGSASGSFIAPKGSLTGSMRLEVNYNSSAFFRVEEYKRPKFEVKTLPLEELYQLNDSVAVKAEAISYAGANIDNAQVVYRVTRSISFPWWYWGCGYRYPNFSRGDVEIVNGTSKTDKKGQVEITFKAVPSNEVLTEWNPMYSYRISIDVTDSNGETHSIEQWVKIGQRSRLLKFTGLPNPYVKGKKEQPLKLAITDLNGEDKEGKGTIQFYSLKTPSQFKNLRYWEHPDSILFNENKFEENHPFYSWEESDYKKWEVREKVAEIEFNHNGSKEYKTPTLDGGMYRVIVTMKDIDGEKVKTEGYIWALDFKKNKFPITQHLFTSLDKTAPEYYQPGDEVNLHLGSPSENLDVLYRVEKNEKIIEEKWINLKKSKKLKVQINESDRGGFHIHLSYVKNNRSYQTSIPIAVPWANKKLDIEFISFRDKTLPGSQEEYKLKISGPDKDAVVAELVAGMYDASLDDFVNHKWSSNFYPSFYSIYNVRFPGFNQMGSRYRSYYNGQKDQLKFKGDFWKYPVLYDFGMGFHYAYNHISIRGSRQGASSYYVDGIRVEESEMMDEVVVTAHKSRMKSKETAMASEAVSAADMSALPTKNISAIASTSAGVSTFDSNEDDGSVGGVPKPQIRTNLNETVFFFPKLETDKDGNVLLSFKMNEALTKWKLLALAHTKDLKIGMATKEVVTQKDLMVVPNPPRFLRDNDVIIFTSKINNLTDRAIDGTVQIELLDAITMQPLTGIIAEKDLVQDFKIEAKQSTIAKWKMNIPEREIDAITYRVIAVSGSHSDGEENVLPVLTNRMLVTETMPLTVDPLETKAFTFSELQNAGGSMVHHNYSFEYTSNPAWYAVQAMPYIDDHSTGNHAGSVFNRLYTNVLASHLVNKHPRIKAVFDEWKRTESDALISNLEKNEELKSAILKETPWVRQALSETEQKKNIALLFDLNLIANSRKYNISLLQNLQKPDGGFGWYGSHHSNRYTSQHILEGFGHLSRLGISIKGDPELKQILNRLMVYCDEQIRKEYDRRDKKHEHLSEIAAHYLYTRSFFKEQPYNQNSEVAFKYYLELAEAKVLDYGIYMSGMLGLTLNRYNKRDAAQKITESLLERALTHPELGMYWNEGNGFNWYELPIERHSMMIELMVEMNQKEVVDDLKFWLLRNKQTNHWKTSKATAAAIYALLVEDEEGGMSKWVLDAKVPTIKIAGKVIDFENDTQAGTGYVKTSFGKSEINLALANVEITNPNEHVGWGGIYWQYFEDMDKVKTFEKTPLKLRKSLYKKVLDDKGEKIIPVNNKNLIIGDKLVVRIEIEVDRSMEYIHLKDMRASGLEPMSTLSTYKWSHGLGYYQSSRDLATDFFISYLPKGKYVFEYDLRVQHAGTFSNGITTIQSMYAPEYTSHSNGEILTVIEN